VNSLSGGREHIAIPGPSVMPERVLAAMSRAMPDIYSGELVQASDDVFDRLPALARTTVARPFVTISNGHGAWEMAISNTLSKGDKVLVAQSGFFSMVWGRMAEFSGVEVEVLPEPSERAAADPAALEARLRADTSHAIKAVFISHVDTATSVLNDIPAVRRAIDAADHPALLMVDCIASMGCDRFEMDAWGVDVALAASQKGLMTPPGVAFVWAGPRALAAHATAGLRTGYWDWTARAQDGPHYLRYCGTPPVSHLFALREALLMIEEETIEGVWHRHQVLADAVRAAVDAWSAPTGLSLNIVNAAERSNAVTTVLSGSVDPEQLREICRAQAGLTLGVGIGALDGKAFRFGHMGHVNAPMVLGMLGTAEAALVSMNASLGSSGVAAAAAVVGAAMRQHS
jgi:alanine-glyoxylate transaminase / serine-glyoxylate transaminase / serine-pyruvate transaminase